jgi:hypothetical protein
MASEDDFVYLPVPRDLYPDVISFLSERLGGDVIAPVPEPDKPELDEALVRRIYDESEETHRQLLKILAGRAGEWVPYTEISDAMGYETNRSLPGTLGAFGRRVAHRYDGVWPFEAKMNNGRWEARMDPSVAAIIAKM